MEKKGIVPEVIVMRALASLAVVLMHAIGMVVQYDSILLPGERQALDSARILLLFSTPTFAFMSAFLIGFSKRKQSFGQVLSKRIQYLLLPFLVFAVVYAAWGSYNWQFPFAARLLQNLRGGYHGYFVLVVMQFYLVHALIGRLLGRLPPLVGVVAAGLLNTGYLMALNLGWVKLPSYGFNWYHLFPAWAFYYVLGFYAGRNRAAFQAALRKRWVWGVGLLAGSAGLLLHLTRSGILPDLTSQRFDLLPYVLGVVWVFFPLFGLIRRVPPLLNIVSRTSFGIYLLHWLFLELFWRVARNYLDQPKLIPILALFGASVICSIAVTLILNRWRWGAHLVGKLGANGRGQSRAPDRPSSGRFAYADS